MKAFHGDQKIKDKYLARVLAHQKADEIVKGQYWEKGRCCAVGCTIHSSNHKAYEDELGIPEWLARVEDVLFEGMPLEDAKEWPYKFLDSIKPGLDLEKLKAPFMIYILESILDKFDHDKCPDVKSSIDDVINLYKNGGSKEDFEIAARAARAAEMGWAAEAATRAAIRAAEMEWAAEAAARAAVYKKFADKLIELIEGLK